MQLVYAQFPESRYTRLVMYKTPLADLIREQISRRGQSVRGAAERIGISDVALLAILKGQVTPRPATIRKIARWSGLSEEYLLRLTGQLGPPIPRNPQEEIAGAMGRLNAFSGVVLVPLLGRIPASWPNPQEELREGYVPVSEDAMRGHEPDGVFALRVRGWSMVGAGIAEGDTIVIDANAPLEIGRIIIADVSGEQTVKRFGGISRGQVRLIPDSSEMAAFVVPVEQFRCIGVVFEVHKRV